MQYINMDNDDAIFDLNIRLNTWLYQGVSSINAMHCHWNLNTGALHWASSPPLQSDQNKIHVEKRYT